ncbi:UNC93-like protein 3 [Syzygium oleosum]|uniref:UNC93-like protein 3 n=1 Tax=Syzygium oleosum TaxID=219896 RepID=UPI0024BA77A9|nr:UNC93-like protein 3 [Syzygium oleosum]
MASGALEAAKPEGAAAPPPVKGKEELPEKLEVEEAEQEDRETAAPEEEAEASDEEALLVAAEAPPAASPPRGHARDVHILSCGFLLIFSAYGAAQNLESTVNIADNLGTTSLGILYVSFIFFSVVASQVVRSLGPKNAILLGTTGLITPWLLLKLAFAILWKRETNLMKQTIKLLCT